MHVLTVASECFPFVKTGGLADVAGALPAALAARGHRVETLIPGFPSVLERLRDAQIIDTYGELHGGPARVLAGRAEGAATTTLVVDAPHLFARQGHPYLGPDGSEWSDNGFRFAALAVVARELAVGRVADFRPDVVHAHDWQAGLVPAYLAFDGRPRPATVMTVHNLAFQGQMPAAWLNALGLPAWAFRPDGFEYYGSIGFLKAGLYYADQLTTVSPTYALEIQGSLWGMGLEGLLAGRAGDLSGIVNGIDLQVWNPAGDPHVQPGYDADHLAVKGAHKAAVQARFNLERDPGRPLFCVISRLTWQKGMDVLLDALDGLIDAGGQLVVLGTGDAAMEERFRGAEAAHPGRIATWFGYDEGRSHQLQAGADAVVVASRFEPCGLTQLYGLRYGSVPVVARTGGLVDTVVDIDADPSHATGFVFDAGDPASLAAALRRVARVFAEPERWAALQRRGMAQDLGWDKAAGRYIEVYERALARRG